MPVGIYLRLSQDRNGDGLSIERQEQACRGVIARKGWAAAPVLYIDRDISAWSGAKRPAYNRLCADIKDGTIGGAVVYNLDRLTRQSRDLEPFLDLCEAAGVTAFSTVEGDIDFSTSSGRYFARSWAAHSTMSSDDTSRRVKAANVGRAASGLPHGGRRCYGFEKNGITHRPAEVAIIQEVAGRVIAGENIGALVRDLTRRGDLSSTGQPWTNSALRRTLISPRLAGRRVHLGKEVGAGSWEPIISTETSLRLRSELATRRPRLGPIVRYSLTGVLECGVCHDKLRANRHGGSPRYECANGHVSINQEPFEGWVRGLVVSHLMSLTGAGQDGYSVTNPRVSTAAEAEVENSRLGLDELQDMFAKGEINRDAFNRMSPVRQARLETALRAAAVVPVAPDFQALLDLTPQIKGGGNWVASAKAWNRLPIERQAAIVGLVLERVTVNKATRRGFDLTRFEVIGRGWKVPKPSKRRHPLRSSAYVGDF
jgi:site-specific DNA recombinase